MKKANLNTSKNIMRLLSSIALASAASLSCAACIWVVAMPRASSAQTAQQCWDDDPQPSSSQPGVCTTKYKNTLLGSAPDGCDPSTTNCQKIETPAWNSIKEGSTYAEYDIFSPVGAPNEVDIFAGTCTGHPTCYCDEPVLPTSSIPRDEAIGIGACCTGNNP